MNRMPPAGTGHIRAKRSVLVALPAIALAAAVAAAGWHVWGEAQFASRRGMLYVLREAVLRTAERQGRYPSDIGASIVEAGLQGRVAPQELRYVARGQEYDPQQDGEIFHEVVPRRYGFRVGRFEVRQRTSVFHNGA